MSDWCVCSWASLVVFARKKQKTLRWQTCRRIGYVSLHAVSQLQLEHDSQLECISEAHFPIISVARYAGSFFPLTPLFFSHSTKGVPLYWRWNDNRLGNSQAAIWSNRLQVNSKRSGVTLTFTLPLAIWHFKQLCLINGRKQFLKLEKKAKKASCCKRFISF